MKAMNDILLNLDNSFRFENGDLVVGEAAQQHQRLIVESPKGEFDEFPNLGCDASQYIDIESQYIDYQLVVEIQQQFANDGMTVFNVELNMANLKINAHYE